MGRKLYTVLLDHSARVGNFTLQQNFGLISIDWNTEPVQVMVEVKDMNGVTRIETKFSLEELQTPINVKQNEQPQTSQQLLKLIENECTYTEKLIFGFNGYYLSGIKVLMMVFYSVLAICFFCCYWCCCRVGIKKKGKSE